MTEDQQKRLNLFRYGLLLVVVVALVITPTFLVIGTANFIETSAVVMWTVVNTAVVAAIAVGVYQLYKRWLLGS